MAVVDQSMRALRPAGRAGPIAAAEQAEGDPHGAACCADWVAAREEALVRARQQFLALHVAADEVGGHRQALQHRRRERRRGVRARQFGKRLRPRAAGERLEATIERTVEHILSLQPWYTIGE